MLPSLTPGLMPVASCLDQFRRNGGRDRGDARHAFVRGCGTTTLHEDCSFDCVDSAAVDSPMILDRRRRGRWRQLSIFA